MVGLSDSPCVERISDSTLFGGLKYMFGYKSLVQVLNSEIEKVKIREAMMYNAIAAARDDGKIIRDYVVKWQRDLEEICSSAEEFSQTYKNRCCLKGLPLLNPVSRFRLGREAVQKTKMVIQLTDSGKRILADDIAYLPVIENLRASNYEFQDFQSRKDAYGKLWEALVSENSSRILGICGMAGVGKTGMMEEIWRQAKDKKIFDKVARADVGSEQVDVIKLQNQIAGYLNCNFESENNIERRACQLKSSLTNGGKILVILDDVWTEIPLDVIGISFGDGRSCRGCKILFTSREKYGCSSNNCTPVMLTPLTLVESWDLFSNTVGTDTIDSLQDESLAKDVCNKCGGLPLVIKLLGKSLNKSRSHNIWMDTLFKLENCKIESIPQIDPQLFACFKLSIDYLAEDAKACLFLSCLFAEDADIPIRILIQLATGSQLVYGGRTRVLTMVYVLMSKMLLLQGKDDQHVKMHTFYRSVARSIAVRDTQYAFLSVRCGSQLPHMADYATRKVLHLDLDKYDFAFPHYLLCPDLHTLGLRSTLEPQFSLQAWDLVGMFPNLRFLVLSNFYCRQQFSLRSLSKLRSLLLDHCNLFETNVSFFPESIETLCISDCHLPEKMHLPNLKCLRKLEIHGGTSEVAFVPNTISSLSSLQELHIQPILDELSKFTGLTSLQICFSQFQAFEETNLLHDLLEFKLHMGRPRDDEHYVGLVSTKLIELSGRNQFECFEALVEIVRMAKEVIMPSINGRVRSICISKREASACLRYMHTEECDNLESIAKISHNEIQESLHRSTSFSKLTILDIRRCSAIQYLFCDSFAKRLRQLQQLYIYDCPMIEVIVMNEGTSDGGDIINFFPKLKSLKLCTMPRLTSFYKENKDMHSSSISEMDRKIITLIHLRSVTLIDLPKLKSFMHSAKYECHMPALEEVQVDNCNLSTLSTCSVFPQLKDLRISNCRLLEHIVEDPRDDETSDTRDKCITLSKLSYLGLKDLPKLKSFMQSAKYECKPALVEVQVHNRGLSSLFTSNIFKNLQQLRELKISGCESLESIVEDIRDDEFFYTNEKIITHSRLSTIDVENLPNLKSFSRTARCAFELPALYTFRLVGCPRIENFTTLKTTTGLVSVYTEGQCGEEVPDLNVYIRQGRPGGSNSNDTAEKSSSSNIKGTDPYLS